jgi:GRASP55/65 PDZ-like domain
LNSKLKVNKNINYSKKHVLNNKMGNETAKEQGEFIFGLRVVGIDRNSPLINKVALYEDFIREINGYKNVRYIKDHSELISKGGKTWVLKMYNIITDTERELTVDVKDTDILSLEEKLGIRFKAEEHECSLNKIMRVLNVQDNSPGDDADLKPKTDFVLTSLNIEYYDVDHFASLVSELHEKVPGATLKLVVYNILYEEMRIVVIQPSRVWGGGLLGVEFGSGF